MPVRGIPIFPGKRCSVHETESQSKKGVVMGLLKRTCRKWVLEFPENLKVLGVMRRLSLNWEAEDAGKGVSVVIFSKDRPMQLEALMGSYWHFVKNPRPPVVIYNASTAGFSKAYKALFERQGGRVAKTINDEGGFKTALKDTLASLNTRHMMFLVDDIVFIRPIDLGLYQFDSSHLVPSLRLAPHIVKSYMGNRALTLPALHREDGFFYWKYNTGRGQWGYPLSVDGHIFHVWEVRLMVEALDFRAPNSFEYKLQKFNPIFRRRKGVCQARSVILNIPANRVQQEIDNRSDDIDPVELLRVFPTQKIDFLRYEGMLNESCHEEHPLYFSER